jgi:hypothetical protein
MCRAVYRVIVSSNGVKCFAESGTLGFERGDTGIQGILDWALLPIIAIHKNYTSETPNMPVIKIAI